MMIAHRNTHSRPSWLDPQLYPFAVLNWTAAPFGSQEDLLLTCGVEGADHTLDAKRNPVTTDQCASDV